MLRVLREETGTLTLGSRLGRQLLRSKDGNRLWCGQLLSETIIQLESGGGPVHAPCPMRGSLNLTRQTPALRLLIIYKVIIFLVIFNSY